MASNGEKRRKSHPRNENFGNVERRIKEKEGKMRKRKKENEGRRKSLTNSKGGETKRKRKKEGNRKRKKESERRRQNLTSLKGAFEDYGYLFLNQLQKPALTILKQG